ncbi:hypothetical protein K1719_019116 [Acacia pycnantha]|nr:hypothetical protein K1719_019116 [Acacia pycnantha]
MEEVQISSPLVWKETDTNRALIGKVLANKSYTRSTMEAILRKAWNLQSGFDVVEVTGNTFMFKFLNNDEYNRIFRCPVWIQLHNVPLEALYMENAITIGGYVGEVMMVEDPYYNDRYLCNFLWARVVLDLRKPLAYGFWLPRPDGRKIWIPIKYEKLQNFCYNCGKLVAGMRLWLLYDMRRQRRLMLRRERRNEGQQKVHRDPKMDENDLFAIRIIATPAERKVEVLLGEKGSMSLVDDKTLAPDMLVKTYRRKRLQKILWQWLFCGSKVQEVISGINKMNLKRNADEDWDSVQPKKMKLTAIDPNSKLEISVFANNLKKNKARARKYSRKKEEWRKKTFLMKVRNMMR